MTGDPKSPWTYKPVSEVLKELETARITPDAIRRPYKAWLVCKVRGHRFAHRSRVDGYVYRSARCFRCGRGRGGSGMKIA